MTKIAIDNDGVEIEVDDDVVVNCIDGKNYLLTADETAAFKKAEEDFAAKLPALLLEELRQKRNRLLADSDWTQVTDSQLSDEKKTEWAAYRQKLRQLPATEKDVSNPTWPEQPS
tara:strand:- start:57 stop:401 length:345 start_codon:yes stop_codon:yes gene_type:complete